MRRLLSIVLALLLVTVATATPAIACVATTSSMGTRHACCEGPQAIVAAPAGSCCVLSAPISERSFVEARFIDGKGHATPVSPTLHSALFQAPVDRVDRLGGSLPRLYVRTIPLYLQQLSLLI